MSASLPQASFAFPDVVALYEGLKRQYVPADDMLRALIHVHLGLALWLVLALVLRKRLSSMVPLVVVWLVVGTTEMFDISAQWPVTQAWVWQHAASDMAQSLTWPTVIWAISFWREKPGPFPQDEDFPASRSSEY